MNNKDTKKTNTKKVTAKKGTVQEVIYCSKEVAQYYADVAVNKYNKALRELAKQ